MLFAPLCTTSSSALAASFMHAASDAAVSGEYAFSRNSTTVLELRPPRWPARFGEGRASAPNCVSPSQRERAQGVRAKFAPITPVASHTPCTPSPAILPQVSPYLPGRVGALRVRLKEKRLVRVRVKADDDGRDAKGPLAVALRVHLHVQQSL